MNKQLVELPVDEIKTAELSRPINIGGIDDLADSIRQQGIIEPLIVAKEGEVYILLAGARRLMAAKQARLATVPCIIVNVDHKEGLAITLQENMYRQELTAYDEYVIYAQLRDRFTYSNIQICRVTGKKEAYISQRLSIGGWAPDLREALHASSISFSVARELSRIDDRDHLKYLLHHAINDGTTYRVVQQWCAEYQAERAPVTAEPSGRAGPTAPSAPLIVLGRCFWCDNEVELLKLISLKLCTTCFERLQFAKEQPEPNGENH